MLKLSRTDPCSPHGSGTQSIFYDRDDVYFTSIHGDPEQEFPYFLGYADETGEGAGTGYNLNHPLPLGTTGWDEYKNALDDCLYHIAQFEADILVVSLGVDTFEHDPISQFKLKTEHFHQIGQLIAQPQLPTLFIFEGGYAVEDIGINTVNVLQGFEST